MACTKRPAAFYAFNVVALFTIGFIFLVCWSDRLVVLNRKSTIEEIKLTTEKIIQQAFLMEEVNSEETTQIQEWLEETVVESEHVHITLRFGLWQSTMCVHAEMESMEDDMNKHDDDDSSSSEEGHRKKWSCNKLSTKFALGLSTMFLDMNEISDIEAEEQTPVWEFNPIYFIGNTCMTEHRVEITIGFVMLLAAVFIGSMAFEYKMTSCRAVTCLICLLVASIMIIIPVGRIFRYNMVEVRSKMTTSDMHFPHALLALLLSAVGTLIMAIIFAVGALRQRMARDGKWTTLENEADSFSEKKNGISQSLVFIPEPLNGKAELYDTWCDVKPVEYMEPEKKPPE